jgi:hypothetical protein
MHTPGPRPGSARWLRLPRRTARLRLTVLYGGAVFLACGATVLAFTYLLYSLLNGRKTYSVLLLPKQGKAVPIAAVQRALAAIRVAGLGQLSLDRQQLLAASAIALAVIAMAAAAIGWLIAGRVLRPPRRRPRPRPVHRPRHRRRPPRRQHHRPAPARRRPGHRRHLPPVHQVTGLAHVPATPSRPHEASRTPPQSGHAAAAGQSVTAHTSTMPPGPPCPSGRHARPDRA